MRRASILLHFVILAAFFVANTAWSQLIVLPVITNADFETGAAGFGTFPGYTQPLNATNPAQITNWPGSGNRGLNPGNGGAGTPFRDNGNNATNVAFLQINGANITHDPIPGFQVGRQYRVSFDYNSRSGNNPGITTTIGGSSFIDSSVPPVGGANSYYTGNVVFTAASTTLPLSVTNTSPVGDHTVVVDNFSIFANGPTIANNGFEAPVLGAGTFQTFAALGVPATSWTPVGGSVLSRNISGYQADTGDPAVEGEQHAVLQGTASLSQTVTGFEQGATYNMSLFSRARAAGQENDLEVYLDFGLPTQITLLDQNINNLDWLEITTSTFAATKSSYLLTLRSTNPLGGDRSTFVDDLWFNQLTAVPEPASIALWMLMGGCAVVVAFRRVRR